MYVRAYQGVIAFTLEELEGDECNEDAVGWKLTTSGRYAHCRQYVQRAAAATGGLEVYQVDSITPRWNRGKPVAGTLFLLRAL